MTTTDRLLGLNPSVAYKVPCRVATVANITLSGLQTIDGVTLVDQDRVLVRSQTNPVENGIYVADASTWTRAEDANSSRDMARGTQVYVTEGAGYGNTIFVQTTSSPSVGSSSLTFGLQLNDEILGSAATDAFLAAQTPDGGRYFYNVDRQAVYKFDTADFSSSVTADPSEAFFIAPDSDATGASGAYVMQFRDKRVHARHLGIKPLIDCTDQWNKAIEYINSDFIDYIELGSGTYLVADTLDNIVNGNFTLQGVNHGATILRGDSTTGSHQGKIFDIGNDAGAGVVGRVKITDMAFGCNSSDASRRVFGFEWASDVTLRDIRFESTVAGCLQVRGENPSSRYILQNITGSYDGTKNVVPWDFECSASNIDFDKVKIFGQGVSTAPYMRLKPIDDLDASGSQNTIDTVRYLHSAGYCQDGVPQNIVIDLEHGSMTNLWMVGSTLDQATEANLRIIDGGTGDRWLRHLWLNQCFIDLHSTANTSTARNIYAPLNGTGTRVDSFEIEQSVLGFRENHAVEIIDGGNGATLQGMSIKNTTFGHINTNASLTPVDACVACQFPIQIEGCAVMPRFHSSVCRVDHLLESAADTTYTKVVNNEDAALLDQTIAPYGSETAANRGTWEVHGNSKDHESGKSWRDRKETHTTDAGITTSWRTSLVESTATLTANRSINLRNDGARIGQEMTVLCKATLGGFQLQVRDNDSTTIIHTFSTTDEWMKARYNGTAWEKIAAGSL